MNQIEATSSSSSLYFFFSSRRRHTRWPRDWSSDVCSSDLRPGGIEGRLAVRIGDGVHLAVGVPHHQLLQRLVDAEAEAEGEARARRGEQPERSEERRVGKEGRARGWREN